MTSLRVLVLMAKYWQPGKVKTRLASLIGDEQAAAVHRSLTIHLVRRLDGCADRRVLAFAPNDHRESFREQIPSSWDLLPQGEGDLGARMRQIVEALTQVGGMGTERTTSWRKLQVLLIGADLPTLTPQLIEQAFLALGDHDLVIGPAEDGGYYLLGMTQPLATDDAVLPRHRILHQLFQDIPWGTAGVRAATLATAAELCLQTKLLNQGYDIDEWSDLKRLIEDLEGAASKIDIELREELLAALGCRRIPEIRLKDSR